MSSTEDTRQHIKRVRSMLDNFARRLVDRGTYHDLSKLKMDEKPIFDEFTPKLKNSTYGSEEYKEFLSQMKPALDHHYASNRHHPEHFENGILGMTLIDVIEMFCDWKAASERHENGDIIKSIKYNKDRFVMGDVLTTIMLNTAKELWEETDEERTQSRAQDHTIDREERDG